MWCFYWHSVRQLLVGSCPKLLAWLRHSCRFDTMILTKIPHAWYNHSVPLERILYLIWTKKGSAFSEMWRVASRFGSRNRLICIHLALVFFFCGLYYNRQAPADCPSLECNIQVWKAQPPLSFSWLSSLWHVNLKHSMGKLITAPVESNKETKISGTGREAVSSMLEEAPFASPGQILPSMVRVSTDGLYSLSWGGGNRDVYLWFILATVKVMWVSCLSWVGLRKLMIYSCSPPLFRLWARFL